MRIGKDCNLPQGITPEGLWEAMGSETCSDPLDKVTWCIIGIQDPALSQRRSG